MPKEPPLRTARPRRYDRGRERGEAEPGLPTSEDRGKPTREELAEAQRERMEAARKKAKP